MTLLLIRVDHQPGGEHLAIRGLVVDQSDGSWSETSCAERLLSRDEPVLREARDVVLSTGGPAMAPAAVGRRLWDLVTGGKVGTWWQAEVAAASDTVRTVLDVRAPELRSVPWELMAGVRQAPPFRSDDRPWVRAHTPWQPLAELAVPVRLLVVVGDPAADDLEVEAQLAAIHGALRQVPGHWHVEILLAPSIRKLRAELKELEPDVLHVVAHGAVKGGEHVLRMMDEKGVPWALEQRDVHELPLPVPRLVILDACRSAGPAAGRDSSSTFADEFLARGCAAVITMQGDIKSVGAVEFSRTLYQELAAGTAVDIAAARGRRAIDDLLRQQNDDRCWALPCLSVATDPDRVLPVRVAQRDEQRLAVPPYSVRFEPIGQCVDRSSERRRLWRLLDPETDPTSPGLMIVTGEKGVGKSAVVLSALLTLRLRGRNVVYVDLAELALQDRRASWLTVLRAMRNGIWDWVPELPAEPRARFDHELAFLVQHQDPVSWSPESQLADQGDEFPSEGDKYAEWIERIFTSFGRMLAAVTADEPLLLVLDAVGVVEDLDLRTWLSRLLFEPAGREKQPRVHLVVVGTGSDVDRLSAAARDLAGAPMQVDPFRAAELPRLAREFYARLDVPLADDWWPQVRGLVDNARSFWKAEELASVLRIYRLYPHR